MNLEGNNITFIDIPVHGPNSNHPGSNEKVKEHFLFILIVSITFHVGILILFFALVLLY